MKRSDVVRLDLFKNEQDEKDEQEEQLILTHIWRDECWHPVNASIPETLADCWSKIVHLDEDLYFAQEQNGHSAVYRGQWTK